MTADGKIFIGDEDGELTILEREEAPDEPGLFIGFDGVGSVRQGKVFDVELQATDKAKALIAALKK